MADILAHPAGFLAFNIFTVAWFAIPFLIGLQWGWHLAMVLEVLLFIPGYMDLVTWFSGATQFTIGFQNRLAEEQNMLSLRNQIDLSRLMLAVAEEVRTIVQKLEKGQAAQGEDIEEIQEIQQEIRERYRKGFR